MSTSTGYGRRLLLSVAQTDGSGTNLNFMQTPRGAPCSSDTSISLLCQPVCPALETACPQREKLPRDGARLHGPACSCPDFEDSARSSSQRSVRCPMWRSVKSAVEETIHECWKGISLPKKWRHEDDKSKSSKKASRSFFGLGGGKRRRETVDKQILQDELPSLILLWHGLPGAPDSGPHRRSWLVCKERPNIAATFCGNHCEVGNYYDVDPFLREVSKRHGASPQIEKGTTRLKRVALSHFYD